MRDLSTQQHTLIASEYDLRITNLARFLYSKMPVKSGRLIDIGAGNGLFLKFFKDRGFKVEGIELEKDQVHEMKADTRLKGVSVKQGDITRLSGKAEYDVVIASDVIEHIEDDAKALKNLYTFVKPGGYLVITVPAHSHLYGKRDKAWGHYRRYDVSYLRGRMAALPGSDIRIMTHWNTIGYFAYYFYERILGRPIEEKFRYSDSTTSKFIRAVTEQELKLEEVFGGTAAGLTLVAMTQKTT